MAGKDPVRVGIVGAGAFVEDCHLPGIQAHPHAEVAALCARHTDRAAALAARFGVRRVFADYRELVASPEVDAVTVAAPDALHGPVAIAALEAGKHVLCEKPLAMTVEEARRMVLAAERAGRVAMVSFTYRYTRGLPHLRRLVREGVLGTPFHAALHVHWGDAGYPGASLSWSDRASESAAGTWADGASHLFDALAFVLAPVRSVCAQMMVVPREEGMPQPETVDVATCLARLELPGRAPAATSFADREAGTVHATLMTSRVDPPPDAGDEMTVLGTRAAAVLALTRGDREVLRLRRAAEDEWTDVDLPDDATTDRPVALARMMGAFVDAVIGGRLGPDDAGFADGLAAQRAIDAAVRSARTGRWTDVSGA